MLPITIGHRVISSQHTPFIIAEMSGNHNQSLERALAIVDAAADAGADAIKLQTYTPETITLQSERREFRIDDPNSLWKGSTLYDLYQEAHTPWAWHKAIFDRAKERGLLAFSTPFDETAVDFLENLDVPAYKIASFENTHHPLLKKIAATGKPIIMSTGVVSIGELQESVELLRTHGCKDLILLKCTSTYPASPEASNLRTIPHMKELFKCPIGLSDHTMGIGVAVGAVALGAEVIEKHFTLSRADGGVDSAFSLEPAELKALVEETRRVFLALGNVSYTLSDKEKNNMAFKRSIYFTRAIKAGEKIEARDMKVVRPARGLPSKYIEELIGREIIRDIEAGTPAEWTMIR